MNNEEKILDLLAEMKADMTELKVGQTAMDARLVRLEAGQKKLEAGQKTIRKDIETLKDGLMASAWVDANQSKRITALEERSTVR